MFSVPGGDAMLGKVFDIPMVPAKPIHELIIVYNKFAGESMRLRCGPLRCGPIAFSRKVGSCGNSDPETDLLNDAEARSPGTVRAIIRPDVFENRPKAISRRISWKPVPDASAAD